MLLLLWWRRRRVALRRVKLKLVLRRLRGVGCIGWRVVGGWLKLCRWLRVRMCEVVLRWEFVGGWSLVACHLLGGRRAHVVFCGCHVFLQGQM